MKEKIRSFEQMTSWQKSTDFAVRIYECTSSFPQTEQFGVTSQIRRSAVSISANIAEGFGRRSNKEKIQFYTIAYGSLLETKSFLYLCQKLNYISENACEVLMTETVELQKMLSASMKALRNANS